MGSSTSGRGRGPNWNGCQAAAAGAPCSTVQAPHRTLARQAQRASPRVITNPVLIKPANQFSLEVADGAPVAPRQRLNDRRRKVNSSLLISGPLSLPRGVCSGVDGSLGCGLCSGIEIQCWPWQSAVEHSDYDPAVRRPGVWHHWRRLAKALGECGVAEIPTGGH
jgi:hypothetical protein